MIIDIILFVAGTVGAWALYRQEQRDKIHLSRNNWSSFLNGVAFAFFTWTAIMSIINIAIGA